MRLGIAHHFGWAVAVTATDEHEVVDRRRIELVEPGVVAAPIHHRDGQDLDDDAMGALVADVRASVLRATRVALEQLPGGITSLSLRDWPDDFPTDLPTLRRPPYEARADSVMYLQLLEQAATERGWAVHRFDAQDVEALAAGVLGDRADEVLHGPRRRLGAPWGKDQRIALAATVLAQR